MALMARPCLRRPRRRHRIRVALCVAPEPVMERLLERLLVRVATWLIVLGSAAAAGPLRAQDALDAELKQLSERAEGASSAAAVDSLRQDLLTFQRKHYGTAQAVKAAGILRGLPSPLDRLDAHAIPALERFDWHPKETVAVLGEHRGRQGGPVTCALFSKNGKWLVSGSSNGYVRVWDPKTMRLEHTFGHSLGAYC